ncbi:hypothetical protein J6590_068144 [Homalodisca vitripennis]|nr:hypothetical protein J6590_068144 [Homalodisca vitripennis]
MKYDNEVMLYNSFTPTQHLKIHPRPVAAVIVATTNDVASDQRSDTDNQHRKGRFYAAWDASKKEHQASAGPGMNGVAWEIDPTASQASSKHPSQPDDLKIMSRSQNRSP